MKCLSTLLLMFFIIPAFCQESPYYKFGKVSVEDLQKKVYPIDSNANAVILSDIGESRIEGNSKGWFSVVFSRHRIVHILNKSGYSFADVAIPLYTDGQDEQKLQKVKGVTYNLENGKIVETKLEKSALFKDKQSKNWIEQKFTLPNVKEGCIVEYQYEVSSDFIDHVFPWAFQGECPRLWSEYQITVPQFLNYQFISQGYLNFSIRDKKDSRENFTVRDTRGAGASETYNFTSGVTTYRWVIKDVPELKQENFTSTLANHIAKIEFELAGYRDPLPYKDIMGTWPDLSKKLLKAEYFGDDLQSGNGWMADDLKNVTANAASDLDKAQKIFAFVRDNFTCTDHSALYLDQSLKNVWKTKKGTVSEINLLLTAMLRHEKLQADPVILSTRDNGYTYAMYPMISRFNYVISQVKMGDAIIYLDASQPRLGFGKLLSECYNGHARIINELATPVDFAADSIREGKLTSLFISNGEKGNWIGSVRDMPGYFESYEIRDKIKSKGKDEFFKEIKKAYGTEAQLSNAGVDSLDKYDNPISIHYDLDFEKPKDDVLYLNPMFGEGFKTNPFKSAQRFYPVEMPYTRDETFSLTIEVPEGYVVDELPKQLLMKLDDRNSGAYEYRISQSGSTISLLSRLKINRTFFDPEEYDTLREFFNLVVKKQNEQIVFKKKK